MSDQPENENQQSMNPEEVRQSLLAEIEATQQAVAELSNEQLEKVVGGGWLKRTLSCLTCGSVKPYTPVSSGPPTPTRSYSSLAHTSPLDRRSSIVDSRRADLSPRLEHTIDNARKAVDSFKRD